MITNFIHQLEKELRIPRGSIAPETQLTTIPQLDSMGKVELLVLVDSEYGVHLEPQHLDRCATVDDLFRLVERPGRAS
jgi:acyl carrier protein